MENYYFTTSYHDIKTWNRDISLSLTCEDKYFFEPYNHKIKQQQTLQEQGKISNTIK